MLLRTVLLATAAMVGVAQADVVLDPKLSGTGDNVVFDTVGTNKAQGHLNGQHVDLVDYTDLSLNPLFTAAANGNDIKIDNTSNLKWVVMDPTDSFVVPSVTQVFSLKGTGDVHASVLANDGVFNFDLGTIDPSAQSGFTFNAINGETILAITLLDVGGNITDFEHNRIDVNVPSSVPIPSTAILFTSGLLGLTMLTRRKKVKTAV